MNSVVTGLGVAAAGLDAPANLLDIDGAACAGDFDPTPLLGGRGLRFKDRATKLALLAAKYGLQDAGLLDADGAVAPDETTGVVVSSNLGNLDTVCRVAEAIRVESVGGTSPMDLPNASSNVIASSIAIKFGLYGPNLMVCNGETSGLDAVYWATVLIGSGRVRRALVIGVETTNPTVQQLTGELLDGAAALVVESRESAHRRGVKVLATLGGYARRSDGAESAADAMAATGLTEVGLLLASKGQQRPPGAELAEAHDLEIALGPSSGALGVLQCVAGVTWLSHGGHGAVLATAGSDDDGRASLVLRRIEERP